MENSTNSGFNQRTFIAFKDIYYCIYCTKDIYIALRLALCRSSIGSEDKCYRVEVVVPVGATAPGLMTSHDPSKGRKCMEARKRAASLWISFFLAGKENLSQEPPGGVLLPLIGHNKAKLSCRDGKESLSAGRQARMKGRGVLLTGSLWWLPCTSCISRIPLALSFLCGLIVFLCEVLRELSFACKLAVPWCWGRLSFWEQVGHGRQIGDGGLVTTLWVGPPQDLFPIRSQWFPVGLSPICLQRWLVCPCNCFSTLALVFPEISFQRNQLDSSLDFKLASRGNPA